MNLHLVNQLSLTERICHKYIFFWLKDRGWHLLKTWVLACLPLTLIKHTISNPPTKISLHNITKIVHIFKGLFSLIMKCSYISLRQIQNYNVYEVILLTDITCNNYTWNNRWPRCSWGNYNGSYTWAWTKIEKLVP